MSPHYTSLRDGNTTTIPGNYRAKDYKAKAFHIKEVKDEKDEQGNDLSETTTQIQDELFHTAIKTEK
jgi:hypothetical protein